MASQASPKSRERTASAKARRARAEADLAEHRLASARNPAPRSTPAVPRKIGKLRDKLPGNPDQILVASEAVALIAVTAYEFLGPTGDGTAKMPDPRAPIATLAAYSLLGIAGSFGETMRTLASWTGGVLALTLLVTGARGKGLVLYINQLAKLLGVSQPAQPAASVGPTGPLGLQAQAP